VAHSGNLVTRAAHKRIDIAGRPEAFHHPDVEDLCIRIPLTGAPDQLLIEELSASPQISSYFTRLEPRECELIAYPNEAGMEGLSTLLTAIGALLARANQRRLEQAMTEEEREARAAEARKRQIDAELNDWWTRHNDAR
jgi:hypothetical protein